MAAPKLEAEQREQLLAWLAAEYSEGLIRRWFDDRGWPPVTSATLAHYRRRYAEAIAEAREARRSAALAEGLARKEERVRRLAEHADALEAIKWVPDAKGRLWNEKAWRETLDDIAREMGQRRPDIEGKLVEFLDQLRDILSPEDYARVLARFAAGATGSAAPGE